jgi:hypothetical protein
MTGLAEDRLAAVALIIEEYQRLQRHYSEHSLLRFIGNIGGGGFDFASDELFCDFFDKYTPKPGAPMAVILTRYYIDLRNAVDLIEGIDRSPKERVTSHIEHIVDDDSDVPF